MSIVIIALRRRDFTDVGIITNVKSTLSPKQALNQNYVYIYVYVDIYIHTDMYIYTP